MTTTKRPRPRAAPKTSPRRLRAVQRQAEAIRLRAAGLPLAAIAARLGFAGKQGAHDAILRGLAATVRKPADTLRMLDLKRLDRLFAAHFPRACRGDHQATAACLRIMERQAALLGLDAPRHVVSQNRTAAAQGGVVTVRGLFPCTGPSEQPKRGRGRGYQARGGAPSRTGCGGAGNASRSRRGAIKQPGDLSGDCVQPLRPSLR